MCCAIQATRLAAGSIPELPAGFVPANRLAGRQLAGLPAGWILDPEYIFFANFAIFAIFANQKHRF